MPSRFPTVILAALLCSCAAPLPRVVALRDDAILTSGTGITFVSVDGQRLKPPQSQISVSPGRHHLALGVDLAALGWRGPAAPSGVIDAPLDDSFKAKHSYTLHGTLAQTGRFTLVVVDETERAKNK
jgi:hypothetical protein